MLRGEVGDTDMGFSEFRARGAGCYRAPEGSFLFPGCY